MLINLSNHPQTSWDKLQLNTAINLYKTVVDVPFPQISPEDTIDQVDALAQEIVDFILSKYREKHMAIHIMGELTFTYRAVAKFKEKGISCIASTTERLAKELPNNEKITTFRFVKFREYF